MAAACANLLLFPTTNESNVYLGFNPEFNIVLLLTKTLLFSGTISSTTSLSNLITTLHFLLVIKLNVLVIKSKYLPSIVSL